MPEKKDLIRHGISFAITFVTGFGLFFVMAMQAALETGQLPTTAVLVSMAYGGIIAGTRAVLKVLFELLNKYQK